MPFQIIRNDITKVKADAIVNTANPDVAIGAGVDSAIYNAAGKEKLLAERAKIGVLSPGQVGVTQAFDLDAKYIIHVCGPWWDGGLQGDDRVLRSCYDKALLAANENGCNSIAFPVLSTGTYGFPKKLGIQIAVDAFTSFLEKYEMDITLVVLGDDSVKISGELVDEVDSFIDTASEQEVLEKEYVLGNAHISNANRVFGASLIPDFLKRRKEEEYDDQVEDQIIENIAPCASVSKPESLDDVLQGIYTDSLEKHLQKIINKKGLKNSEVYAAANISKQYFSKLLKGQVKPSKEKMLALAVGLRLNLDETVDFLRIAGYALSPISQTDAVVEYFIRHEDYNVLKIDIVLFDYGLDPLSNG